MKHLNIGLVLSMISFAAPGQNVGINNSGGTPNTSSILDLNTGNTFTTPNGKGILIPNILLTGTGDVTTIGSPATSLLIFNTATVALPL